MTPDAHSDQVLLEHIRECITRIQEQLRPTHTQAEAIFS